MTDLRKALAQKQEPVEVAWILRWVELLKRLSDHGKYMKIPSGMTAGDCYEFALELERFIKTAPPKREWVGLTDEEIGWLWHNSPPNSHEYARAIEAKLKEKNT